MVPNIALVPKRSILGRTDTPALQTVLNLSLELTASASLVGWDPKPRTPSVRPAHGNGATSVREWGLVQQLLVPAVYITTAIASCYCDDDDDDDGDDDDDDDDDGDGAGAGGVMLMVMLRLMMRVMVMVLVVFLVMTMSLFIM